MTSIIFASVPIHGHVTPLLPLAAELVARGDRVRFLTGSRFAAAVAATGAEHVSLTGDADFILVITAKDMEDYEAFTRRFFYENHDIKGFKTMVVMDRVKAGFAFPIEA